MARPSRNTPYGVWRTVRGLRIIGGMGNETLNNLLVREREMKPKDWAIDAGIAAAREKYGAETIRIEAQTYARKLYEDHGFRQDGEEFLEDDIPHIPMIWHAPKD